VTTDLFQHPEFLRRSLAGLELIYCTGCFGLFWITKVQLKDLQSGQQYGTPLSRVHEEIKACRGSFVYASDAEPEVLQAILTRLSRKQYKVVEEKI
jgi:hypothetical protein